MDQQCFVARTMIRQLKMERIGILVLLLGLTSAESCLEAAEANSGASRIVVKDGHFVEKQTGKRFVPLGMDYYRLTKVHPTHAGLCPDCYDRPFIETMMADAQAWGFNSIRTYQAYRVGEDGILTSRDAKEINPKYLDCVIHFLEQARRHKLHVIFSWDIWNPDSKWWASTPMPSEDRHGFLADPSPELGVNTCRFGLGGVRTRANAIASLITAIKKVNPGLLPVVLTWEVENEVCFVADQAPFKTRRGSFGFAGRNYDMASDVQVQSLMDDAITQWANACTATIRSADPEAMVSAGLFSFAAVGRGGPGTLSKDKTGDPRIPARPMALLKSDFDYLDIHLYAWQDEKRSLADHLKANLDSEEWGVVSKELARRGKPMIAGETGVFAHYLRTDGKNIDHKLGLDCLRRQVEALKQLGAAGVLYWHYGNPESTKDEDCPALRFFPEYAKTLKAAFTKPGGVAFQSPADTTRRNGLNCLSPEFLRVAHPPSAAAACAMAPSWTASLVLRPAP